VSVVAADGDTAGEPVGDVVGIGVGGGGSATALRHTTLIRTSASSLAVISHDGIDASSRNGADRTGGPSRDWHSEADWHSGARRGKGPCRQGDRPERASVGQAFRLPGFASFWRDNLCVVRSINLAFTDKTELVPPIPRFAIGQ